MKAKPEQPDGFPKTLTDGSAQVRLYWQANPKKRLNKATGKLVKTAEFSDLYTLAYYEPAQVKNLATDELNPISEVGLLGRSADWQSAVSPRVSGCCGVRMCFHSMFMG